MNQEDVRKFVFNKEIKQAMVSNEIMTETDTSVKDGNMVGVWKIE